MIREEALKILDTIPTIGEQVDALEMAIKALEQQPCEDAISRQAAIDATCANCVCINCRYRDNGVSHASCDYVDKLKRLPPVKGV